MPWRYQLQVRALSAFLTLAGLCSARSLPALFHAGPAHGVLTLQGRSPPAELCDLSVASALLRLAIVRASSRPSGPSGCLGNPCRCRGVCRGDDAAHECPSSGRCSLRVSVSRSERLSPLFDRDPLGFLLPRGFSLLPVTHPGSILSRALRPVRKLSRSLPLRVLVRQGGRLDSLESASPCEVSHLLAHPGSSQRE